MNLEFSYYTVIIFLSIFSLLCIQLCLAKSNTLTRSRKKIFYLLFNAIIVAAFCEWMGNCLQGSGSSTRLFHIIVKAVELSVAPSIAFFASFIIEKKHKKCVYAYLIIHAALEWLSGIFGFIYYVDADSTYIHGRFYWIYIAAYVISMIYCIFIVICNIKKYQYNGISYFLLLALFMLTGIAVQLYNSNLKVDYLTLALTATMLYVFTLEMIYQTDELTGLINRRGYENYISHLDEKCVILFFDVDHFKNINDNYGHAFGDTVLHSIGKEIRISYSRHGKCFRFGGDEFCAILIRNQNQVEVLNQQFCEALEALRQKDSRFPTVSIGYSCYDPKMQDFQAAISEADQMMYQDKANKK